MSNYPNIVSVEVDSLDGESVELPYLIIEVASHLTVMHPTGANMAEYSEEVVDVLDSYCHVDMTPLQGVEYNEQYIKEQIENLLDIEYDNIIFEK